MHDGRAALLELSSFGGQRPAARPRDDGRLRERLPQPRDGLRAPVGAGISHDDGPRLRHPGRLEDRRRGAVAVNHVRRVVHDAVRDSSWI